VWIRVGGTTRFPARPSCSQRHSTAACEVQPRRSSNLRNRCRTGADRPARHRARARRRTASPQAGPVAPPSTIHAPEFHELARMRRFVFDALSWLGGIRQPARLPRSSPVRPSLAAATGTHTGSLHRRRAPAQRPHARASEPNGARLAVRSRAVNITGMDCLPINVARNRSSLCA
jgi:hypothetical protein